MPEDMRNSDGSSPAHALEAALAGLDRALAEAGRAAAAVRSSISGVAALQEQAQRLEARVSQLEAAVIRARESLTMPLEASSQPHLRPVPSLETGAEVAQAEAETAPPAPTASETEDDELALVARPASHCLRLDVSKKVGSLDLKVVDGSVNDFPAVVDVALLDYDGRQATLKLWISESEDPNAVREALLESVRRRLGDETEADVRIEFEEESAA